MSGGNNGKVLTVSRILAKILIVSRKSHHPIETLYLDTSKIPNWRIWSLLSQNIKVSFSAYIE